jgi:ParB-like chromosome segregation protein Spo0J
MRPHPENPNTHPRNQIEILAKLIEKIGWRLPITVSNLSGFIIRGHGRLSAARLLKMKTVPVNFQDYANREEEITDLVADNTLPELAAMDESYLADLVKEIEESKIDVELLGLSDKKLDKLLSEISGETPQGKPEVEFSQELHESSNYIVLVFDNDIDWLQAQTLFDLKTVKALDSKKGFEKKGIGRVLNGPAAIEKIRAGSA